MKKNIKQCIIIIFCLFIIGCGFFNVLDYTDENNESYITLVDEDGCNIRMKYLGTYPSYPDIHGIPLTKDMIIHEQTYFRIRGPEPKKNEPISTIVDCHVELKDEQNNIIPFIHIEVLPVEKKIYVDSFVYKNEKDHVKFKPIITSPNQSYKIFYLYNDTSKYKTVLFYMKLTLSLKGKERVIEKRALLKRKEGTVFGCYPRKYNWKKAVQ